MTDERAGQLNEPNLIEECCDSIIQDEFDYLNSEEGAGSHICPVEMNVRSVIYILQKRGLINELGIEILKRDGVIK